MELKLEEVANGLAAWAANKKEIEWVRLIGSRVTSKRHTDGSPPLSSSDLDIAIKINAKHLKKHRDGKKHVWSDETDSLSIFGFDHEISWLNYNIR